MPIKLGELLIREKLLTSTQVEEALKYQVIFGGRLGTNLIEMDLLEEGEIARVLSKKMGVPFVDPPNRLMKIPEQTLQRVPKEMARKHKVIPLRLDNRRLYLAMADPSDLKAIDEIAFRTGYVIRPVVVPEIRLILALEKHYQVERKRRYIQTTSKVGGQKSSPGSGAGSAPLEEAASELGQTPAGPQFKPLWEDSGPEEEMPGLAEAPPEPLPSLSSPAQGSPVAAEAAPAAERPQNMESVAEQMAEARDRDDITEALAGYLGREFSRGALFLVRGAAASGWKATKNGRPVAGFDQVEMPLEEPSLLQTVATSKAFYLGPVTPSPLNSMLLQQFGGKMPEAALLVPVTLMGRIVAILYVDGGNSELSGRLLDLQRIATKAAMAYEILILRTKILSS